MQLRPALAAVAAATLLAGCGSAEEPAAEAAEGSAAGGAFPASVEHTFGSTTIEEQPERVVVLGWNAQDVVYALGLEPVGMPSSPYGGGDDGVLPWDDE